MALSVEEQFPAGLRRHFIKGGLVVYPNRKLNAIENVRFNFIGTEEDRFDSAVNISNALHPVLVSEIWYHYERTVTDEPYRM